MNNSGRINGFDALRAIAMWLGVVLHALIVYKSVPEPNWPHDDSFNSEFLDWLYQYIHVFRMPLFFLVAGFFARLVITRSGIKYFRIQRTKRILIPFIIGVIVIVPVSLFPFHFYNGFYNGNLSIGQSLRHAVSQMLNWNGLLHLWFLYYLLFFYIIALIIYAFVRKSDFNFSLTLQKSFGKISLTKIFIAVLVLYLLLFGFKVFTPPVYTGIKPNIIYLLYYGFFFTLGWLMQINMNSVNSLTRFGWWLFIAGSALSILRFLEPEFIDITFQYFFVSLETICLVAGLTGIFIKHCNLESKLWRYFSDASYWVYLIHISIVVTLQVLMLYSVIPGWFRMPLVIIVTFAITMITYHYFVRYTIIGEYLHGKRIRPSKPRL